jgi:hypothetical protein
MGSNHSFFRFIKHVKIGIIEDELNDHLLSSSSSLKDKEALTYLGGGGGGIWEVGQTFETLWKLFVAIEHGTCLDYVEQLGNQFVSESFKFHVSPYYFDSFEDNFWLSSRSTCRHTLSTPSKRTFGYRHTMVIIKLCLDPFLINSNVTKSIVVLRNVQWKYQPYNHSAIFMPMSVYPHLIHHYSLLS